jgi:hypothetical protein
MSTMTDIEDWSWRLVKKKDSNSATLELSSELGDLMDGDNARYTAFMHVVGESLVKMGMQMVQSRISDDDEDGWDDDEDY